MKAFVFSNTLQQTECAGVTVARDPAAAIASLQKEPGKDIWLFGGGALFRSMLDLGRVDEVDVAIIPVLLGGGLPLLPPRARRSKVQLKEHKTYPKTGTVSLRYAEIWPSRCLPVGATSPKGCIQRFDRTGRYRHRDASSCLKNILLIS